MIPKIIHYCWFGKQPLDKKALACIESWKRFFPGYEIMRWDETNFDIDYCPYTRQAYDLKKWAFVSDVARLYALYEKGGIYFDTDVEVIKPFDDLLSGDTVFGFESDSVLATCVMISQRGDRFIQSVLDRYRNRSFADASGKLDFTPNPVLLTKCLVENGFTSDNTQQQRNGIRLLTADYFSPYDTDLKPVNLSDNTRSIHHFAASWLPRYRLDDRKKRRKIWYRCSQSIGNFVDRIRDKAIRIIAGCNPLLGDILQEDHIRVRQSYRLSRRYGGNVFVYKNCSVYISPTAIVDIDGTLKIGCSWQHFAPMQTNFVVCDGAVLTVKGNFRIFSGSRTAVNPGAQLLLGDNGFLNMGCNIRCFHLIHLESGVRISENCIITDSDNHDIMWDGKRADKTAPIHIKQHSLIGLGCTVLKGVTIGEGAVVAAGAVVTKDVADHSLVGGIPANVIRKNVEWE